MSAKIKEELAVMWPKDPIMETPKKPKRSYTREFLLSLSELEVCKKLPNGFDESLLSEFEDASHGIQDRQRFTGSSSFQGFRRTDYGSSVPARGDTGGYSRGIHRWDSLSSGRSDADSDSELGRRYGSLARRPGQHPEHDGLLGNGSFPRPPGHATGASAPRYRPNSNFLNRSNEPYQPPRPFKAVPHSRRETKDSYNDETFGSSDSASEDKVEEEKKRRAEFELMRKEQQKALLAKQKLNPSKLEDPLSDITGPLENRNDGKISNDSDKVLKKTEQDDSGKSVSLQAPASRPFVPPGFVNSSVEKSSTVKTLMLGDPLETRKIEMENNHRDVKSRPQERDSCELQCVTVSPSASISGKVMDARSVLHGADQVKNSSLTDVSEVLDSGEMMWLDPQITEHKMLGESGRSTSILEKLFGSTLTASSDGASNLAEDQDAKADVSWGPNTLQAKFTSWFLEDDKKVFGDITQEKPTDLLSLISGCEKGGSDVSDVTAMGPILASETMLGHVTSKSATTNLTGNISELFSSSDSPEQKPAVLTCEDLEQSMLSEIGGSSSHSRPAEQETIAVDEKAGNPDTAVDSLASQHLLSLLQKPEGSQNVVSTSVVEEASLDKPHHQQSRERDAVDGNNNAFAESLSSPGKTLTLEALFGAAFMNELHSAQQNSVGSARHDVKEPPSLPLPSSDGTLFSSIMNEFGSGKASTDGSFFMSNNGIAKLDNVRPLLGVHDPGKELEFSKPRAEVDLNFGGVDRGTDVRLPEEDSLISLGDPINAWNSILLSDSSSSRADLLLSSNASNNVMEKLAVLGAALEDERSIIRGQDLLLFHGPHETMKPKLGYQDLHPQASSPRVHATQINHGKPLFDPLHPQNAHLDPHMKFMPPDAPLHHLFPVNMGHPPSPHHSASLHGFDRPIPPSILQQMHMAGNLPPPHLVGGFPGGAPMPPHSDHNPAGCVQEHNPMQGFPFGQQQPNFGGPGMPLPGPEFGGAYSPPEAFQRLLEMELRGNPKQVHPFEAGGHGRLMYGPELDMGFRYR